MRPARVSVAATRWQHILVYYPTKALPVSLADKKFSTTIQVKDWQGDYHPFVVGGVIAIIGLLLRIALRPWRVWLEEAAEGCTIRSSGKETMNGLKIQKTAA